MARSPIIPSNFSDPTGTDSLERAAMKQMRSRVRKATQAYVDALDQIQFVAISTNARYEFRTLPSVLSQLLEITGKLVDEIFLSGGERGLWFSIGFVLPAYEKGTTQAWRNLGVQDAEYAATRPAIQNVLLSEPYQTRIGLIRAREFEQMKGLSAAVKQSMSQQLTAGLAQGIGPREIAKNLTTQSGIEESRANRIARTEVNQALRTARLDETQDAVKRLSLKVGVLHISALSPTTRKTHAERSGTIHSVEDERDWFAEDGNSINCRCATSEVLLDEKGQPRSAGLVDKVRKARDAWEAKNAED
jgi:SPP1 gp7 family putative phage head morphogenesis protein